ncbi:hypothetical protein CHS0354_034026 [Potamilus streckersoni]|uniref:Uncharacterized protein n=1 Tax=Potamilus streckersoni TaxID=2493646 RepID=A0AAE0VGX4_9BIVA|nr:hypothetical protein CHS0354_034026 [Potamilus streckersoni]
MFVDRDNRTSSSLYKFDGLSIIVYNNTAKRALYETKGYKLAGVDEKDGKSDRQIQITFSLTPNHRHESLSNLLIEDIRCIGNT